MKITTKTNAAELVAKLDALKASLSGPASAAAQTIKAKDVPVGGVFKYEDELYFRSSGEGRVSGNKLVTVQRPCVAINLETGDIAGLETATVEYYPDATVSV